MYNVSFPKMGIENLKIDPVAFEVFGFKVYWYGIVIAVALILCVYLAMRASERFGLNEDMVLDVVLIAVPSAFIGARLYFVIFSWDMYKDNILKVFDTRQGGMAFYGGIIGGMLGILLYTKYKKIKLSTLIDFFIVYIPLGQAIGRWGNFFNQEAFGCNTNLPWGMISNGTSSYLAALNNPAFKANLPVHPTFLYESLANILIFAFLLYIRKRKAHDYECLAWYSVLYGAVRFLVESIRTDALMVGSNLRASMLVSLVMVLGGLAYIAYYWFKDKNAPTILEIDAEAADETETEADAEAVDETEAATETEDVESADETGNEADAEVADEVETEADATDEAETEAAMEKPAENL